MNLESVKEEAREIFVEFTNGLCEAMALGRKSLMSIVNDAMRLQWLSGMTTNPFSIAIKEMRYGALYNWYAVHRDNVVSRPPQSVVITSNGSGNPTICYYRVCAIKGYDRTFISDAVAVTYEYDNTTTVTFNCSVPLGVYDFVVVLKSMDGELNYDYHCTISNLTFPVNIHGLFSHDDSYYSILQTMPVYIQSETNGLCPAGYHIPSRREYKELFTSIDSVFALSGSGFQEAGNWLLAGDKLKDTGTGYWTAPNDSATNEYGFKARGSSYRTDQGDFSDYPIKTRMGLWTSDDYETPNAFCCFFDDWSPDVTQSGQNKKSGMSVRAIKNDSVWMEGDTVTDFDGNIYNTVKIGNQVWLTENLMVTHYNNGDLIPIVTDASLWEASVAPSMCYFNNEIANASGWVYQGGIFDTTDDSPTLAIEKLRHYRGIYKNIDLNQIGVISNPSSSDQSVSDLLRSGQQPSIIGANTIVFSSPLGTDNYTVNVWIIGTSESQYDLGDITKAETGFTVSDALIEGTLYYQVIVIV